VPVRDPKKMKFDEIVDSSSETFFYEPQLAFALDSIRGARVLNIGCWTGNFESLAVEHAGTSTRFTRRCRTRIGSSAPICTAP